jgi:DNA mismatch repair protein MutS
MTFQSILDISSNDDGDADSAVAPACFHDLNLDQIVTSITEGKQEYRLAQFFYKPLKTLDAIAYRQAVMSDLKNETLFACVAAFSKKMQSVREHLSQSEKLRFKYQKEAWLLDGLDIYCGAVVTLLAELHSAQPSSEGFLGLLSYLEGYFNSADFRKLSGDICNLRTQIASIRYNLLIGNGVITVTHYNEESDYSAEIQADFEKFKQGAVKDHVFKFNEFAHMNHIEGGVLERVARLFPEIFSKLDAFSAHNTARLDATICQFDREVAILHPNRFERQQANRSRRNIRRLTGNCTRAKKVTCHHQ